jgi:myo-inositol-1(or 4)-monophosphatase
VACRAADMVQAMHSAGLQNVKSKSVETDIVTEADVASEKLLRAALHELDPIAGFWGEESNTPPSDATFWLVDPIDGTVNYAHALPYYAVNIAFVAQRETVLGVTVQLPWRRIFWAEKGKGAWLREPDAAERRLQVSSAPTLRRALLATGFPYHNGEADDNNNAEFVWFSPRSMALRVLGAAALDIAEVASGMLAGFWEGWLNPWDAAGGALMVNEAGGRVTDYTGAPWRFGGPGFVASNGLIHDAMLEGIRRARADISVSMLAQPAA